MIILNNYLLVKTIKKQIKPCFLYVFLLILICNKGAKKYMFIPKHNTNIDNDYDYPAILGEEDLYYLLTRFYDPNVCRFISPDSYQYLSTDDPCRY